MDFSAADFNSNFDTACAPEVVWFDDDSVDCVATSPVVWLSIASSWRPMRSAYFPSNPGTMLMASGKPLRSELPPFCVMLQR